MIRNNEVGRAVSGRSVVLSFKLLLLAPPTLRKVGVKQHSDLVQDVDVRRYRTLSRRNEVGLYETIESRRTWGPELETPSNVGYSQRGLTDRSILRKWPRCRRDCELFGVGV